MTPRPRAGVHRRAPCTRRTRLSSAAGCSPSRRTAAKQSRHFGNPARALVRPGSRPTPPSDRAPRASTNCRANACPAARNPDTFPAVPRPWLGAKPDPAHIALCMLLITRASALHINFSGSHKDFFRTSLPMFRLAPVVTATSKLILHSAAAEGQELTEGRSHPALTHENFKTWVAENLRCLEELSPGPGLAMQWVTLGESRWRLSSPRLVTSSQCPTTHRQVKTQADRSPSSLARRPTHLANQRRAEVTTSANKC